MLTASTDHVYRGRFAPSPTGPLHFGSLIAAVASRLEALVHGGQWLLRMEDVDAPRCAQTHADAILRGLTVFGFEWDGPLIWQRDRTEAYALALDRLRQGNLVFPCGCTRRELADSEIPGLAQDGATLYPGTCRHGLPKGKQARAWRLRVDDVSIAFTDAVQGHIVSVLAFDVGDFVLRRADNLFAYQLAVVVDDADAGITHVVRGADLLHSTPRQIYIQQCLGLLTPAYAHVPVAVNATGEKLSKQTGAPALDLRRPGVQLVAALDFLGQAPPECLSAASVADIWHWARLHWSLDKAPRVIAQAFRTKHQTH